MPLITVLTTTYNRASLLPRLYESLCRQTCKDFEWIVVDDGSTDGTEKLFNSKFKIQNSEFQSEVQPEFQIRYYKKANGGKHTAVNFGVKKAKGELVFIADSDDMLPKNALDIVSKEYEKIKGNHQIAGVAGLDANSLDGKIIGTGLLQDSIDCNAMDIRYKYHVKGDLKEVFRTSVLRDYPFPEIAGERFCPEQLVWFRIAQKYNLHYINQPIYVAEYQPDGITSGITKARMNSPIASMMTYAEMLHYNIPLKEKVKAAINYWRFRCCYKRTDDNKGVDVPRVGTIWNLAAPFGMLFHLKDRRMIGKK